MHDSFYNKNEGNYFTIGHLPHLSQQQKLYAVTFRLCDSLPKHVIEAYQEECASLYGEGTDLQGQRERFMYAKMMAYMDQGHGACWLRNPAVREVLEKSLEFVSDKLALVHAYVIMPNHVHVVLETHEGIEIQRVMHSLKSYTALRINRLLHREGGLWQREYHDRIIRNMGHYENAINYIVENPRYCKEGEYSLKVFVGQDCNR